MFQERKPWALWLATMVRRSMMRMTPLNRLRYQAPLCETESKASWYFSCSQEQQKTKPAESRRRLQRVAASRLQL